jgi:Tfp pilus assembly protein PilN
VCFVVVFVQVVVRECEEDNVRLTNEKQLLTAKLHDITEQQNQQTITDEQVLAVVEQKAQEWQVQINPKQPRHSRKSTISVHQQTLCFMFYRLCLQAKTKN